jgi:hypothetical protein
LTRSSLCNAKHTQGTLHEGAGKGKRARHLQTAGVQAAAGTRNKGHALVRPQLIGLALVVAISTLAVANLHCLAALFCRALQRQANQQLNRCRTLGNAERSAS